MILLPSDGDDSQHSGSRCLVWADQMMTMDLLISLPLDMKVYEDNETDDIVRKSIMIADGRPVDFNSLVLLTGNK